MWWTIAAGCLIIWLILITGQWTFAGKAHVLFVTGILIGLWQVARGTATKNQR
jgi:hypothetical protein